MSLRIVKKILKKVNSHAEEMSKLSDNQLKDKTQQFKKRLKQGETLDNILPEAFAAMREADKRVLGMFPYDVQVMGGIVLHQVGNLPLLPKILQIHLSFYTYLTEHVVLQK